LVKTIREGKTRMGGWWENKPNDDDGNDEVHTSEMTSDMVALGTGRATVLPLASETEVVCALSADVVVAEMVVEHLCVFEALGTLFPLADKNGCCLGGIDGGDGGRLMSRGRSRSDGHVCSSSREVSEETRGGYRLFWRWESQHRERRMRRR
jgi:hypothetical protein